MRISLKRLYTWDKEVKWIIAISLGFLLCLWLGRFWGWLLEDQIPRENQLKLTSGILTRLPMLAIALYLLRKLDFQRFAGIGYWRDIRQVQAALIPLVIILMGFFSSLQVYANASTWLLSLFIVNTLLVACIEELTFRGLILPLIIKRRQHKKSLVFVSVLIASGIFGIMHYVNLFREPDNFWGITSQVIFAVSIGVFLGGLMLRTRHILFSIIIHFSVNFSFGNGELKEQMEEVVATESAGNAFDLGTVITLLFLGFMIAGGWYMIRQVDQSYVLRTLGITDERT